MSYFLRFFRNITLLKLKESLIAAEKAQAYLFLLSIMKIRYNQNMIKPN